MQGLEGVVFGKAGKKTLSRPCPECREVEIGDRTEQMLRLPIGSRAQSCGRSIRVENLEVQNTAIDILNIACDDIAVTERGNLRSFGFEVAAGIQGNDGTGRSAVRIEHPDVVLEAGSDIGVVGYPESAAGKGSHVRVLLLDVRRQGCDNGGSQIERTQLADCKGLARRDVQFRTALDCQRAIAGQVGLVADRQGIAALDVQNSGGSDFNIALGAVQIAEDVGAVVDVEGAGIDDRSCDRVFGNDVIKTEWDILRSLKDAGHGQTLPGSHGQGRAVGTGGDIQQDLAAKSRGFGDFDGAGRE